MNVLFKTVVGSRLYGLSNDDSDYDYFVVVDKVKTKKAKFNIQKIVGKVDTRTSDFGTWVNQCQAGVPQALEAMFAEPPFVEVDRLMEFRAGFVAGTNYDNYVGVIRKLYHEHPDSYKHKRHMLRLALNMKGLRERGRFNPTLDRVSVELVNSIAKLPAEHVYNDAMALAWQ